jgi:HlyD family secretion protein
LIQVPNDNLELKPGMTANVTVPYDTKYGVLRVPNAALRFKPESTDAQEGTTGTTGSRGNLGSGQQRSFQGSQGQQHSWQHSGQESGTRPSAGWHKHNGEGHGQPNVVYEMDANGTLRPVTVMTSITDGNYTAVESGNLKEGDKIVTGLATTRAMQSSGGIGYRPGGGRPR